MRQGKILISWERFVAFLFSLSPFLSLYRFPFIGVNVAFFPYLFLFVITIVRGGEKKQNVKAIVTPLIVTMFCYCVFSLSLVEQSAIYNLKRTNFSSICTTFSFITLSLIAFYNEKIRDCYRKNVEKIAIIMSFVVVGQYIFYYVFHTTITVDRSFLLPLKSLFTNDVVYYLSVSGMLSHGMFRPSAFFLEPSHFSQFCSIGLASLLIRKDNIINPKAIFVTIGIILTTSGIGILTVIMLWGYVLVMNDRKLSKKVLIRIITGAFFLSLMFVVFYMTSSAFRLAILRITTEYSGYSSAIEGRLWSRSLLEELSGTEKWFGTGFRNIPVYGVNKIAYYMTGIVELFYCQGIIGASIFCIMYLMIFSKAYRSVDRIAAIMLVAYLPFLIGGDCLGALRLCHYIPFMYIKKKRVMNGESIYISESA